MQTIGSWPTLATTALGATPSAAPSAAPVAAHLAGRRRSRAAPSTRRLLLPRAPDQLAEARDARGENGSFCPTLAATLGVTAVSKIRWAHCVNSKRRLRTALQDERVHMLEVDVSFGELRPSSPASPACGTAFEQETPAPLEAANPRDASGGSQSLVAAHFPTQRSSDLSVEELLLTVMQHNAEGGSPKGLKLDFNQIGCVRPGVAAVLDLHAQLSTAYGAAAAVGCPRLLPAVFFNADVVRGSCFIPRITEHLQEPLPLSEFVHDVASALALSQPGRGRVSCALSLGWTPGLPISSGCRLTDAMADQMLAALPLVRAAYDSGLLQHVTFGVSAACARDSAPTVSRIRTAIGDSADTSMTFFTPTFGLGVTGDEAQYLHHYPACPPDRLFLDLRRRPASLDLQRALSRCLPKSLWGATSMATTQVSEDRSLVMGKVTVC